jgi:hypothetical protein
MAGAQGILELNFNVVNAARSLQTGIFTEFAMQHNRGLGTDDIRDYTVAHQSIW